MPNCPECNTELSLTECTDIDFQGTNETVATMQGICPKCKRNYTWEEIYEFKKIKNLEEIY